MKIMFRLSVFPPIRQQEVNQSREEYDSAVSLQRVLTSRIGSEAGAGYEREVFSLKSRFEADLGDVQMCKLWPRLGLYRILVRFRAYIMGTWKALPACLSLNPTKKMVKF